jgi:hypothetical protein
MVKENVGQTSHDTSWGLDMGYPFLGITSALCDALNQPNLITSS